MKLDGLQCPACGGIIHITGRQEITECPFCGVSVALNDEKIHIVHDDMEQAGYAFEKGRMRAREEAKRQQAERERQQSEQERRKQEARARARQEDERWLREDWEKEKQRRAAENARRAEEQRLKRIQEEQEAEEKARRRGKRLTFCLVLFAIGTSLFGTVMDLRKKAAQKEIEERQAHQMEVQRQAALEEERRILLEREEERRQLKIRLLSGLPSLDRESLVPDISPILREETVPVKKMAEAVLRQREEKLAEERRALQAAQEEQRKQEQRRLAIEEKQYKENEVFYFWRKYNRFAEYPFKLPEYNRNYTWVGTVGDNLNYNARVSYANSTTFVTFAYRTYRYDRSLEKARPIIRDLLWTCDSTLSKEEIDQLTEDLLQGKYTENKPFAFLRRLEAYGKLTNAETYTQISVHAEVNNLPKMPLTDDWYAQHVPQKKSQQYEITNYLYEKAPRNRPAVMPIPDPNEDFDTFMDIFGEEFENEDDAFDAWLEGYANE